MIPILHLFRIGFTFHDSRLAIAQSDGKLLRAVDLVHDIVYATLTRTRGNALGSSGVGAGGGSDSSIYATPQLKVAVQSPRQRQSGAMDCGGRHHVERKEGHSNLQRTRLHACSGHGVSTLVLTDESLHAPAYQSGDISETCDFRCAFQHFPRSGKTAMHSCASLRLTRLSARHPQQHPRNNATLVQHPKRSARVF